MASTCNEEIIELWFQCDTLIPRSKSIQISQALPRYIESCSNSKVHNQTLLMVNPYNGQMFGNLPDLTPFPISPITSIQSIVPTTTIHPTDLSMRRSKDATSDPLSVTSSPSPHVVAGRWSQSTPRTSGIAILILHIPGFAVARSSSHSPMFAPFRPPPSYLSALPLDFLFPIYWTSFFLQLLDPLVLAQRSRPHLAHNWPQPILGRQVDTRP